MQGRFKTDLLFKMLNSNNKVKKWTLDSPPAPICVENRKEASYSAGWICSLYEEGGVQM